jgi:hypothetical protein
VFEGALLTIFLLWGVSEEDSERSEKVINKAADDKARIKVAANYSERGEALPLERRGARATFYKHYVIIHNPLFSLKSVRTLVTARSPTYRTRLGGSW